MKSVSPLGAARWRARSRVLAAGVAALALVAAWCSTSTSTSGGTTPVQGGTAVWAEQPAQQPTYIFPYVNSQNISNTNLFDLQYLMYRPLYWFGDGGQPTVNDALSAGQPADAQRADRHDHAEALHVVQRHPGDRAERHVLAEHGAGRAGRLRRLHRLPGERDEHQGGQPHRADHDDEQPVLADLVPVQRPEPGHPDADRPGTGPRSGPSNCDRPRSRTARRSTTTWTPSPRTWPRYATSPHLGRSWTGRGG